jgi:MinD-like ATPase involved in chromosome partitioning or flagellar assembly
VRNDDSLGYEIEAPVDLTRSAWSRPPVGPGPGPAPMPAEDMVRRYRNGSRLIMVANIKGGSYKTTTALMLASVFGQLRGGGVVAWDNHETRGTLGHRVPNGGPHITVRNLLPARVKMSEVNEKTAGERLGRMRRQPSNIDILASDEAPDVTLIGGAECGLLGKFLRDRYELVVMDTGDNVRAGAWQWGAHSANQLVIPVPLDPEAARAAAWMCDHLEYSGIGALARGAVVVVTPSVLPAGSLTARRIVDYFRERTAAVLTVPRDPRLAGGAPAGYSLVSAKSRRAWTAVAATVAARLSFIPAGHQMQEAWR